MLLVAFIVAQFFTQQMHELTHLLSQTKCAPELGLNISYLEKTAFEAYEKHDDCKFLLLLASRHTQPFIPGNLQPAIKKIKITKVNWPYAKQWISRNTNNYHQARAPPAV